jgi:integrase
MTTLYTRAKGADRLTEAAIKAWLRRPAKSGKLDGSDMLHDGGGLYLRRRAAGAFWALRQVNSITGARTWAALFPDVPYPAATLAEARRKATAARLKAADNPTDLVRDRQAKRATARAESEARKLEELRSVTVRQLFDRWSQTELAPRTRTDGRRTGRKDGGAYVREQFQRRVFPTLGAVAAPAITKADLFTVLDKARAEGKLRTANVLLANLKQMFRFALARELVERNPLDTVTKRDVGGTETERDRVLSADEVGALAKAVPDAKLCARSAAAIWLILATGCRVGEAMAARWEHLDTLARTWHLPDTKNERPHTIHLSEFALRQVEKLEAARAADLMERRKLDSSAVAAPWVFPNKAGDGPVCVKSFGKQLADRQRPAEKRLSRRAKGTRALVLAGGRWTAHDLRRTAATMMAELGISGDVIDECLNHVIESRVRRTYIRDRRIADQARAFDALGVRLALLVDGAVQSNIVQLRAA